MTGCWKPVKRVNTNNMFQVEMEDLKGQTVKEQVLLNERKAAIEVEMAEIEPLVQEAKKAVGNIKSSTLSEVRALRAPPPVVKDILEGVLCLMGIQAGFIFGHLAWDSRFHSINRPHRYSWNTILLLHAASNVRVTS